MFDILHEKLSYNFASASERLDVPEKELSELVRRHRIRTYRIKRKQYIPNFEIDRLLSVLLQEQVQRDMEKNIEQPRTEHHGTG